MAKRFELSVNGQTFSANEGELLLDAALRNGIEMAHDCRAGHCGTCTVRLMAGYVDGGECAQAGFVRACQSRVVASAALAQDDAPAVRVVDGVVEVMRAVAQNVVEIGIASHGALPYLAGQYAQVQFDGYPSRPYSITHPLSGDAAGCAVWLHVRRMDGGHVSSALGTRVKTGHPVQLTGPYGAAHFRANHAGRMVLVATNTGFAPIWAIAAAALRENPARPILVIAGGRSIEALYMAPALVTLSRFANVRVVPFCSAPHTELGLVRQGRPTDFLPPLVPSDVVYACGAPAMVEAVSAFAAHYGATLHADPFTTVSDSAPQSWPRVLSSRMPSAEASGRSRSAVREHHVPRASVRRSLWPLRSASHG